MVDAPAQARIGQPELLPAGRRGEWAGGGLGEQAGGGLGRHGAAG